MEVEKKRKSLIFLDDFRDPFNEKWWVEDFSPIGTDVEITWVKRYRDFVSWIETNGLPDAICFDHDIENFYISKSTYKEYTGYDCAKWLVDYCLDNNLPLPLYGIQSSNPAGKENIDKLLINYNKHYEQK